MIEPTNEKISPLIPMNTTHDQSPPEETDAAKQQTGGGRMRRLVQRLSSHVATMAPHQQQRPGGELLAEMQSLLGSLQPWQLDVLDALTDPARKLCVAHGKMMKAGDDEEGQPRMVIHSTRESLAAVEYLPIYEESLIIISPLGAA